MAKFNQGINGPFKGKVGTVVGASWKGIPYMRSLFHVYVAFLAHDRSRQSESVYMGTIEM